VSRMLGMNPDEVEAHHAVLVGQLGALESALTTVNRVRLASLNPFNYGIEPSALILAPASIVATTVVTALVAGAKENAEKLVGQLMGQVAQQREASAADGGSFVPSADGGYGSEKVTLAMLASLSAAQLKKLLKDDPALAQDFWNNPPDAGAVAKWWKSLSPAERDRLIADAPTVIGNLNGVPYSQRDKANRAALAAAANDPHLSQAQQDTLAQIQKALVARRGNGSRYLTDFNLDANPPLAAIAIGNVDTVDDVTVAVPGMDSAASNSMTDWTNAAQNLYVQQNNVDPSHTHAVIAWIGYQTPTLNETLLGVSEGMVGVQPDANSVFSNALAREGAPRLTSDLDGIIDTRAGEGSSDPRVAVVAHSYGTTTAAYALSRTKYDVSSADFIASAGVDGSVVPTASYLHVSSVNGQQQVYATQATLDGVATIGRDGSHRADPETSGFGAITYSSDGGGNYVPVDGHDALGKGGWVPLKSAGAGHGYFDLRTESLVDMAVVSTGNGTLVSPTPSPSPGPTPHP
jgi:Alpha/beta hydrolase